MKPTALAILRPRRGLCWKYQSSSCRTRIRSRIIQHLPFRCTQILRLSSRRVSSHQTDRDDQASFCQSLLCPPTRRRKLILVNADTKMKRKRRTDRNGGHTRTFQTHGSSYLRYSPQSTGGMTRVSGTRCLAQSPYPVFSCSLRPYQWLSVKRTKRPQSHLLARSIQEARRGLVLGHKYI
jgi:hypothetical protein